MQILVGLPKRFVATGKAEPFTWVNKRALPPWGLFDSRSVHLLISR
jgi:hypothetical protein